MGAVCLESLAVMKLVEIFEPKTITRVGCYHVGLGWVRRGPYLIQIIVDLDYVAVLNELLCFFYRTCTQLHIIWYLGLEKIANFES